ncbi:MarR family winged helix-turn-helix transcriptional regulator [Salinarimonas sp.]|uniref:MarR family winged helix-turn-helix transcriptional regulator n=1 Tax=Salinarimonas sp. TaxID=2766526 RepID=UPI00391D467F
MSTCEDERAEAIRRLTLAGRRLSDATVLFHTKMADGFGLGASETKALGFVQRFGPMTHGELTERVGLKPASVTNIIDRLEEKGWLVRRRSQQDARRVLLSVVPEKVETLHREIFAPFMERLDGVYAEFGTDELRTIARAFDAIAAAQEDAARDLPERDAGGSR